MKIPKSEHPVIAQKYKDGKDTVELGFEYGVQPNAISHILRMEKVPVKRRSKKMSEEVKKYVAEQLANGRGVRDIAVELGVSFTLIYQHFGPMPKRESKREIATGKMAERNAHRKNLREIRDTLVKFRATDKGAQQWDKLSEQIESLEYFL